MVKKWVSFVTLFALLANNVPLQAQQQAQDNFATVAECMAAFKANNVKFYRPTIKTKRSTAPDEVVLPNPTGGCFLMDVPDRIGGQRWVPIEAERPFVYKRQQGNVPPQLVRLDECDNDVHDWLPFGGARPESSPFNNRTDLVVAAPPIAETARQVVEKVEIRPRPTTVIVDQPSWFAWSRNGKWFWPLVGVAAVGAVCLIPEPRCFVAKSSSKTTVNINIR